MSSIPAGDGPLVTIVTPTLDQGRFLEATLRSVLGQTYPRIEHIVVDGGSSDGTLDILRRFEGPDRLRWISEPDRGMYDAVNKGLTMARGSIVAYLNSDDLLLPWAVEVAIRYFEDHPEADLLFGDALRIEDQSRVVSLFFQPPFRLAYLRTIGSFAQPATFWRRRLHETVGSFDADLQYAGDLDFYLRVAERGVIHRLDEFLAVMRLHGEMKTRAAAPRARAENAKVRARYAPGPSLRTMLGARGQAWAARRRLWRAFARGVIRRRSAPDGRWSHFIREGEVRISPWRLGLAQLPMVGLRLSRVVSTGVDWLQVPAPPFAAAAHGPDGSLRRPPTSGA